MLKRLFFLLVLFCGAPVYAGNYGKTTTGASWVSVEGRYYGRKITLPSTETATTLRAYLRSVGSATNGIKMVLYDYTTKAKSYESSALGSFTDTVGGWKDFTFTSSVAAGSYWLVIFADGIAGGGNTVECAYDAVTADTTLYNWWYGTSTTYPTMQADLDNETAGDSLQGTHDLSVYLQTATSAASVPGFKGLLSVGK